MGFKHQIELIMSWLIFLCLSYHEHIFEAKMEAEVRLLEVNCTYFVAKIKFNSLRILKFI